MIHFLTALVSSLIISGSIVWEQSDLRGVHFGSLNRYTGNMPVNFRHVDINLDGKLDVVFDDSVVLAKNGIICEANRKFFPEIKQKHLVGCFGNIIFILVSDKILRISMSSEENLKFDEQYFDGDLGGFLATFLRTLPATTVGDFLRDFDEDNEPEVLVPAENEIRILKYSTDSGKWGVFGALHPLIQRKIEFSNAVSVWPQHLRRIPVPVVEQIYSIWVEGDSLSIIQREPKGKGIVFSEQKFSVRNDDGHRFLFEPDSLRESPLLPEEAEYCRLGLVNPFSFVVERLQWSLSSFPVPLYECSIFSYENKPLTIVRTVGMHPHCILLDMNTDGRVDLLTEQMTVFHGDPKEQVLRFMTQTVIPHEISFYLQREDGSFPRRPDYSKTLKIDLRAPPIENSEMFRQYRNGEILNAVGDFDGDGFRDLLVKESPTRLVLYKNDGTSFPKAPFLENDFPEGFSFGVTDVDGDGKADLILDWPFKTGIVETSVFLTRMTHSDGH